MNKVATVTLAFWIMKICATTLGETAGDMFSMTLNMGYAVSTIMLMSLFLASLFFQLGTKKFHPMLYWLVILTTSTAGTTMSDFMDRTLGLGYALGSTVLVSGLVLILVIWYKVEGSLQISNIASRRAETFYWFAILISNTLGTALGDFLADDSGLGFFGGAALVGSVIALIALLYKITSINKIFLFWAAFILTRPFGATFGDLLTKPIVKGGFGFGTVGSSMVLVAILVSVIYMVYFAPTKTTKVSY
jgi:uncharacterized membrane-anchored protein